MAPPSHALAGVVLPYDHNGSHHNAAGVTVNQVMEVLVEYTEPREDEGPVTQKKKKKLFKAGHFYYSQKAIIREKSI